MSFAEFFNTLSWVLYFSLFLLMTFFLLLKSQTFVMLQMITVYSHGSNLPLILNNLEHDMDNLFHWFKINSLKASLEKFKFMILGKSNRLK